MSRGPRLPLYRQPHKRSRSNRDNSIGTVCVRVCVCVCVCVRARAQPLVFVSGAESRARRRKQSVRLPDSLKQTKEEKKKKKGKGIIHHTFGTDHLQRNKTTRTTRAPVHHISNQTMLDRARTPKIVGGTAPLIFSLSLSGTPLPRQCNTSAPQRKKTKKKKKRRADMYTDKSPQSRLILLCPDRAPRPQSIRLSFAFSPFSGTLYDA